MLDTMLELRANRGNMNYESGSKLLVMTIRYRQPSLSRSLRRVTS